MIVWLDHLELRSAVRDGGERRIQALIKSRRGAHGFNRDDFWQLDIEGVAAEMAAAKALGLEYTATVGQLDTLDGDIGPGLQVRSTKYETGHLLIHESDPDDHLYILVVGSSPCFRLAGWMKAKNGKKKKFWKSQHGRSAHWIPQSELRPIEELPVDSRPD